MRGKACRSACRRLPIRSAPDARCWSRFSDGLVPVAITPESEAAAAPTPAASDTIEIAVSDGYRVRVGSNIDGRGSLKERQEEAKASRDVA